ncbi:hypothetical protein ACO1O0_002808 [Amphichorda felina]
MFLNSYVMILRGAKDAQEYGKQLAWSEHPDAILEFLVKCCEDVLHDIPADTLTTDAFLLQPEPHLKSEKDTDGFDSLTVMAAAAPYRLPAHLDLDRIEALLRASVSAAEDHVWALREDPSYFTEQLGEVKEHCQEMIKDRNGDARIIGTTIFRAYTELEVYTELHRLSKEHQTLHAKYASSISPTKPLPEEFQAALLKLGVIASPPWRKYFVREPPVDADSSRILVMTKSGVKMNKTETQLLWLLRTLWEDEKQLFLIGMPLVLDELERLPQTDPEAKELISAHIAQAIGNLSILSHCMTQLSLYQPWARGFESGLMDTESGIKKEYEEQTNALIQAERNLDDFWATIDQLLYNGCGSLDGTAVGRLLSQHRPLQRTPEWIEDPAAKKTRGGQPAHVDLDPIYKPLSTLYFEDTRAKPEDLGQTPAVPKTKTKTRGAASQEATEAIAAAPSRDVESGPKPTPISVDARALKVFRTLFFDPSVTSSPGEVSWNDFLYAMTSTSVFAAEELYGSVWQFQRVYGVDQSRIQLHEPHPHGKIPFVVARRHGRRLNRNYGWAGDLFVLKGKS